MSLAVFRDTIFVVYRNTIEFVLQDNVTLLQKISLKIIWLNI